MNPTTISVSLDHDQMASVMAAAVQAGLQPEDFIKRSALLQAHRDHDPALVDSITAGLNDLASGRVVSHEELKQNLSAKYGWNE